MHNVKRTVRFGRFVGVAAVSLGLLLSARASANAHSLPAAHEVLPASALLNVPAQSQFPQLKNGCEATSVSMLLTAVHHPVSKLTIAVDEPRDPTPIQHEDEEDVNTIVAWGDPNKGFVGSVWHSPGYGIYHGPMAKYLSSILPLQVQDLTRKPFTAVLASVAGGVPVVVWTTSTFRPTRDWVTWQSPEGPVRATFWEHAVLVVGYTSTTTRSQCFRLAWSWL